MMMLSSSVHSLSPSSQTPPSLEMFAPARGERLLVTGDAKGEFDNADPDYWSIIKQPKALRTAKHRLVLCRFGAGEWLDWDYAFRWAWEQGEVTVLVDEVNHVTPPNDPLFGLRSLITTGRSRGVSCILNTQRPVGIPVIVRSECEKFAIFRLQTIDDRQYMSSIVNDGELLTQPPRYSFWYQHGEDMPSLYRVGDP